MKDPYERRLEELGDEEVTVDRADAPPIKGKVRELKEDGCFFGVKLKDGPEGEMRTFVAFRDIRGIGIITWNYDVIS